MQNIRIVFFDVDGTLIDMQKKQISEKTLKMLRQLKANGVLICMATGRPPASLPKIDGVEFDAYLTCNGSLCYSGQNIIFSDPIPAEDVQQVIQNAATLGRPVSVATAKRLAANGTDVDLAEYYSLAHLELTVAEDFAEVSRQEIYQIMLGCREEDYSSILKDISGARITASWERAADVIPANSGKGTGIQQILAYYHLSKEESLAFGDGNNDIEMLQTVGTGVAMENASARLKAVADDICGHVAEDGIYQYFLQHGMIARETELL